MFKPSSIAGALAVTLAAAMMASACDDLDEPVATGTIDADAGGQDAATAVDAGTLGDATNANDAAVAPTSRDAQIAQIMLIANQTEVAQGQLVQGLAFTFEVRAFASSMATEHAAAIARQLALFQTLGITPVASETSRQMQADSDALLAELLGQRQSIVLERIYIDAQVGTHAFVLDLIDRELLPSATSPELRAELESMRATVSEHLGAAQGLQTLPR